MTDELKPKKKRNNRHFAPRGASKANLNAPLTEQQELFAQHVALTNNAIEAYKKVFAVDADTTYGTIQANSYRAVRHPRIAKRIEELRGVMRQIGLNKFEITAERILGEMAACAFANASDYLEWDGDIVTIKPSEQLTEMQRKAVISVVQQKGQTRSIKLELADKLKALEKLGKQLGLFNDNVKVSHEHSWIENADKQLSERLRALIDRRRAAAIDVHPQPPGGDQAPVQVGILGPSRAAGADG